MNVLLVLIAIIFGGCFFLAGRNAWKYMKSHDGSNFTRVMFLLAFLSFFLHDVLFLNDQARGYFLVSGGLCFALIFLQPFLKIWFNGIRDKIKKALS